MPSTEAYLMLSGTMFAVGIAIFVLMATLVRSGAYHTEVNKPQELRTVVSHPMHKVVAADGSVSHKRFRRETVVGNSEAVGNALYTDYLVPFEVASLFLLVAMIGAIVIGKRELSVLEEETAPDFILDRVESEREVKEARSV